MKRNCQSSVDLGKIKEGIFLLKRGLYLLLVLALIMTAFAGCSQPAQEEEEVAEVTPEEVVKDLRVRQALTLAIDRRAIVEEVAKGGQLPATGYVPPGLTDSEGNEFRTVNGDFGIDPNGAKVEEAKALLAEAGFPDGEGFPVIEILYNTSEGHKAIAEAIQEMWKKNLNIDVTLQNQEWAVFQDTRHEGNFAVARAGWLGDYPDPMTFLDLFTSYSGNNDAHWYSDEFDKLIEDSKTASGKERDEMLYKAEQLMMEDLIVMPIYYYTNPIMVQDRVEGWEVTGLGHWYFGKASTDDGILYWNVGADPKTIDPGLNSANDGGHVINNTFEGLMREVGGNLVPAMAESYEMSEDGLTYTFHLRDAAWSDGEPVTASDFEYAWKRALSPEVASEYGFQMFYIKGAQEFYDGEGTIEDVAIEVVDEKTLIVELTGPTPYFLDLTAFYTYMPVRKDIVEQKAEGWAKDSELTVSNGPFVLADYKTGDKIVLEPNEYYWNKDEVKIDRIEGFMIVDESTQLTAFEAGEMDVIDNIPNQEIPRLLAEDDRFEIKPILGTYYYLFNLME